MSKSLPELADKIEEAGRHLETLIREANSLAELEILGHNATWIHQNVTRWIPQRLRKIANPPKVNITKEGLERRLGVLKAAVAAGDLDQQAFVVAQLDKLGVLVRVGDDGTITVVDGE